MSLQDYKRFYFIGIGGIGMSAIARHFRSRGFEVAGYDKTPSDLTAQLEQEGIFIHFDDNIHSIPEVFKANKEDSLIIYTPAIPKDHQGLNFFLKNGYSVKKRAELLADLTIGKKTIAVAGTHGKTSTAAIIIHILNTANIPFYGFLGGIANNYNTNFIAPHAEEAEIAVVEADEYDRSFLRLNPNVAIVTAIEADHLDIYGTFEELQKAYFQFGSQVVEGGKLIVQQDVNFEAQEGRRIYRYGIEGEAECRAENIWIYDHKYHFDAELPGLSLPGLTIGIPGRHNIENSLAAMAAVKEFVGENTSAYYAALKSFKGVHRRFEVILQDEECAFIDDYAHHPTEIEVTIKTVKELFPNMKISGIFQPHLFTRTRDLAEDFSRSLSQLDEVFLLPIYPARELPIEGITSHMLLEKITSPSKKVVEKDELLNMLAENEVEVLLTIGAGDIDRLIQPIKEILLNKRKNKV